MVCQAARRYGVPKSNGKCDQEVDPTDWVDRMDELPS
jgi:hypothetical protein